MGISKILPYPLLRRGIKGEVKIKILVFRDALIVKLSNKSINVPVKSWQQLR